LRDNQYIRDVYIEEQSDKTYYIVAVLFRTTLWCVAAGQIADT
jgi:hypothetical protein